MLDDGTPADPAAYDYQRAARDALHFAALFDRFIQNLRRFLGYDVQYFAAIEPQKRLAPHAHIAFRGTVSRADLRQVIAATYHQVWWPSTDVVRYDGDRLPVWHEASGSYLDPATGEVLPTWDQALDAIGPQDEPLHVARFGPKFDAQGVLAGSKDSQPVHPVPDQVPHQAHRRLPHRRYRRPAAARRPAPGRAAVRAVLALVRELAPLRHPAQRRPGKASGPARARARPTAPRTSATQAAGSWSPANGRARPSPITAATAKPGCWPCSACPTPPTKAATGGSWSPRATGTS